MNPGGVSGSAPFGVVSTDFSLSRITVFTAAGKGWIIPKKPELSSWVPKTAEDTRLNKSPWKP